MCAKNILTCKQIKVYTLGIFSFVQMWSPNYELDLWFWMFYSDHLIAVRLVLISVSSIKHLDQSLLALKVDMQMSRFMTLLLLNISSMFNYSLDFTPFELLCVLQCLLHTLIVWSSYPQKYGLLNQAVLFFRQLTNQSVCMDWQSLILCICLHVSTSIMVWV